MALLTLLYLARPYQSVMVTIHKLRQRIMRIVAAVTLAALCVVSQAKWPGLIATGASRTPAPNFELTDSTGKLVKLSDFKGRVVLLNFWATWCHGCQTEIPWFIEFDDKYRRDGLTVIGISMDDDGWKSVRPWIAERNVNYSIVIGSEPLGKLFGLEAMPKTLLIDRHGNVASTYEGVVEKTACEKQLRLLLHEGSRSASN
ncbi:MAG TPA: TlpA disulfide reductase family protein [Candidatus Acidoferrales bacterium]